MNLYVVLPLLLLFVLTNAVAGYVIVRGANRLLQFDELFEMLVDDVDANIRFYDKLLATPLFSNEPQIVEAHKGMVIIRQRLDEYARQMEESVGRPLRRREPPPAGPRPVVRD